MNERSDPTVFTAPGFRCSVAAPFAGGATALGLHEPAGFAGAMARARSAPGGRGENFILESELWPVPVRIRPLRHGGLLGPCLGDRFVRPGRSEREFTCWKTLEERGAPVPPVVLAASRRRGFFWYPLLGAVERRQAVSLASWLKAEPRSPRALASVARAAARSIRRFHDVGGIHGDLHSGNLLVGFDSQEIEISLIDLDRTRLRSELRVRDRMQELMRFLRSLEKSAPAAARSARLRAAFLSSYCANDRLLRKALLERAPHELRRIRLHRLGWALSRRAAEIPPALAVAGLAVLLACSNQSIEDRATAKAPARLSLLATGDTGSTRFLPALFEGQRAVSQAMRSEDQRLPVDGLILLGDNFYWYGLDQEHLVERVSQNLIEPYCHFLELTGPRSAEISSSCTIPPDARNPVPVYAVLGNHDIELPESAELQRKVVPEFVPSWTMSPGLARAFDIGEGVSLILFESELAIDDQETMQAALIDAISRSSGPWRILATHRPIATDDRGGVPLGGYPIWVREAIAKAERPVQLVLAGHHHSLQAFALETPTRLLQIGAGSGSRTNPPLASDPPGSLFGKMQLGFVRIDLLGSDDDERLSVSLLGTTRWPILSRFRPHRLLARFEVDLQSNSTRIDR